MSRAIASHDKDRVQTGLTHRMHSNRKLTAKRNRQTVGTACGRMITGALPVEEPKFGGVPAHDCLSCWPKMPAITRKEDIEVLKRIGPLLKKVSEIHAEIDDILAGIAERAKARIDGLG